MANKNSKACSVLTNFDSFVKTKYLSGWDFNFVRVARWSLANEENYPQQEEISKSIKERVIEILKQKENSETNIESFNNTYTDWLSYAEILNKELSKDNKKRQITIANEAFIQAFAQELLERNKKSQIEDANKELSPDGPKNGADAYTLFKRFFPDYRYEILDDLVLRTIMVVDALQEKNPGYDTIEIISKIGIEKITNIVLNNIRLDRANKEEYIKEQEEIIKNLSEETSENRGIKRKKEEELKKQEKALEIYDTLINNGDAWLSAIYMARHMLFDACGINIENNIAYESEDSDYSGDPDEDVPNAEETNPDRENWMLRANTISSFLTLSYIARSVLYKLHETTETNIFGRLKLVDIMKTHQHLLNWRSGNGIQNSDDFIESLSSLADRLKSYENEEEAKTEVWPETLVNILQNDPYLKTAFFNAYRKNGQNYVYHTYRRNGNQNRVYRNTDGVNLSTVMQEYEGSLYLIDDPNHCLFNSNGFFDVSKTTDFIRSFKEESDSKNIIDYLIKWHEKWLGYMPTGSEEELKREYILAVNNALNLKLDINNIDILVENAIKFNSFALSIIDLSKQFENLIKSNSIGAISLKDLINNSKTIKSILYKTLDSAVTYTPGKREITTERYVRYNKSTYYHHIIPSALGDMLERMLQAVNNPEIGLRKFIEDEYLQSPIYARYNNGEYDIYNPWLKALYEDSSDSEFTKRFLEGMLRGLGDDVRIDENFKEKDFNKFYLVEALHNLASSDFQVSAVPLFTTGDSNSMRIIPTPWFNTTEELYDQLANIAFREFVRMDNFDKFLKYCDSNGIERPKTIEKNTKRFALLPYLNEYYDELKELYDNGTIEEFNARVKKYITKNINSEYGQWANELVRQGIAKVDKGGIILQESSISIPDMALKSSEGPYRSNGFLYKYFLNTQIGIAAQLEMFTVSPAFYMGSDDMQKRFKEVIASGTPLDRTAIDPATGRIVNHNEFTQKVIYANDLFSDMTDTDFLGAIEDHKKDGYNESALSKFKANNMTDGQAYRSFDSYRKIMIMSGRWTKSMESVYQIIQRHRLRDKANKTRTQLTKAEFQEILKYDVSFQPLKPFYYGFEKINMSSDPNTVDYFFNPTQIKYSEIPLIPELMPMQVNGEKPDRLYQLALAMEEEEIDLLAFKSTVKVGAWNSVEIRDCQTKEDFRKAFRGQNDNTELTSHELSLEGFRLQQNVPYKIDVTRGAGVQIKKNGYGDLADSKPQVYPSLKKAFGRRKIRITNKSGDTAFQGNSEIPGNFFTKLYSAAGATGYIRSFLRTMKELDSSKKVSERLTKQFLSNQRQSNDSLLGYLLDQNGAFNIPLSEGASSVDNMAALCSILRNDIIKQKMKGGSAVQVSPFGFEDVLGVKVVGKKGNRNILAADCARTFDFSYTDSNGNQVKLDYLTYVDPMTGMPLDINGKPVEPAEATGKPGQEYYGWNTKLGKDFPGIFDLISYRIPTEEFYSAINLRIKRFFPPTMGGIIMVPTQFTTIAGFDFDIDKLYYLTREYKMRKKPKRPKSEEQRKKQLWDAIYGFGVDEYGIQRERTEIYKRLVKARKEYLYDNHITPEEATEGNIVAQSSDQSQNRIIDYDTSGELYALFSKLYFEEEDEEEDNDIQEEESEEEEEKIKKENKEYEFLYQFWDKAGLTEEYGTVTEYVRKFVAEHQLLFSDWETIDPNKSFLENSQVAINNLIFDMYKDRLESEDTFVKRYTIAEPLDVQEAKRLMIVLNNADYETLKDVRTIDDLKRIADEYEKKDHIERNPINISTTIRYQTDNAIYDKLIGISANQNIHQRLLSLVSEAKSRLIIRFGDMFERAQSDSDVGQNLKKRMLGGIDSESLVRQGLGVSVDGVKNHDFEGFNIDDNNYNLACFLLKIGASYIDLGLLLNQPVVTIAQKMMADDSMLNFTNALEKAMIYIVGNPNTYYKFKSVNPIRTDDKKYKKEGETKEKKWLNTKQLLFNTICWDKNKSIYGSLRENKQAPNDFIIGQLYVVNLLSIAQDAASRLSDAIGITKSTSLNSVQSRSGDLEALLQKCLTVINSLEDKDSPIIIKMDSENPDRKMIDPTLLLTEENADDVLDFCSQNSMGMEQAAYTAIFSFVRNVLSLYFPYYNNGYQSIKDVLAKMTKKQFLSGDIYEDANKYITAYISSRIFSLFNPEAKTVVLGETTQYNNLLWYKIGFPEVFSRLVKDNEDNVKSGKSDNDWSKYAIIRCIVPVATTVRNKKFSTELKFEEKGGLGKAAKNIITESWEDALSSDDETLRNIAYGLAIYSFFNSGFKRGKTSLLDLAPVSLKRSLTDGKTSYIEMFNRLFNLYSYGGFINESSLQEGFETSIPIIDIVKAFLLNTIDSYWQFRKIVTKPKGENMDGSLYNLIIDNMENSNAFFTVTLGDEKNAFNELVAFSKIDKITGERTTTFYPCVKINITNEGKEETAIYIADVNGVNSSIDPLYEPNLDFTTVITKKGEYPSITYYRMDSALGDRLSDTSTPTLYGQKRSLTSDPDYNALIKELGERMKALDKTSTDARENKDDTGSNIPVDWDRELKETYSEIDFDAVVPSNKFTWEKGFRNELYLFDESFDKNNLNLYKFLVIASEQIARRYDRALEEFKGKVIDIKVSGTEKEEEILDSVLDSIRISKLKSQLAYKFKYEDSDRIGTFYVPDFYSKDQITKVKESLESLTRNPEVERIVEVLSPYIDNIMYYSNLYDALFSSDMFNNVMGRITNLIERSEEERDRAIAGMKETNKEIKQEEIKQDLCD